ncbi:DNA-invertase [Methanosarcina horonobensis HB-1 = JCM 15518]|uniref:DNA-invertase n=1 Tax=Methanosarcina horonobensis HB-1 = JCM 15518 TaxID=1434110 RepID=A0A0E3SFS1_9EURY|nr:recombinase family protein [Methanosarcina horonobensis]AKB79112.1 DNA-invertase [Methanosarcina horonobensis HB-1 = JCM 15518]
MIRIYYRVSTEKQDFDMQYKAIRDLCTSKGIDYMSCQVYQDFGISGTTADRPDYKRLLSEVQPFDTLIVYEVSRLWRDLEEQSRAMKALLKNNVNIISVADGEIKSLTDTLFADIKGSVNQFEARRLKERINAGIRAKKEKVAKGEDSWNGRGPDKEKRKTDGYKVRWARYREAKNNV